MCGVDRNKLVSFDHVIDPHFVTFSQRSLFLEPPCFFQQFVTYTTISNPGTNANPNTNPNPNPSPNPNRNLQ